MTLSTLLPGRIPNSLSAQRLADVIVRGQADLARIQEQIGTGRKFLLPSEAPSAATQTLSLQKLEERRTTFEQNIQTNQGFLGAADQALTVINDALVRARSILQTGLGDQASDAERDALALEVQVLIQSIVQAGNTQYNGRYLFAGSETGQPPFSIAADGSVRYNGDSRAIETYANFDLLVNSGIDGAIGLRGVTTPITSDLNPALTLDTRLDQLNGDAGFTPGTIQVILTDGPTEIRKYVDLTTAETLNDVKLRIEDAFAAESITITVDIDPGSNSGLRLTPSSGTVEVREVQEGRTALSLGLVGGPVAVLNGADLDPALSLHTTIASLNGYTGIGPTAGTGLRIVTGSRVSIVDLDGATTIGDVLSRIRAADPDVIAEISADGTGLAVSSRLSGVDFSIGENGGQNATLLGIRTLTAATRLADLNYGTGVPVTDGLPLSIVRRDGAQIDIDLSAASTIQDVLDAINAVDPGSLVASLNAVGNGISLTDDSGAGPLTVVSNPVSRALGMDGTENTGSTGVLVGDDVNLQQPAGAFNLLSVLARALDQNDFATLNRLSPFIEDEAQRVTLVRGEVGLRQQLLETVGNQHADEHVQVAEQLSKIFDVDFAEAVTRFLQQQQALEAAMQVAARAAELSILQFL
jgi:flagellar hook-associated protein 3 FlgL